jgi:hypothetical protein
MKSVVLAFWPHRWRFFLPIWHRHSAVLGRHRQRCAKECAGVPSARGTVERSARGGGLESAIHGRIAELLCRIASETNDATYPVGRRSGHGPARLHSKKSLVATESTTPEHRDITAINVSRLVFIDESFCKTGTRREHAWARRGDRALPIRSSCPGPTSSATFAARASIPSR